MKAAKTLSDLQQFRAEKDEFFAHDHRAPLNHEQQHSFKGLEYFAENPQLVIRAKVDRAVQPGKVRMETCLLYTSPSPRDLSTSRMPSSA